MILKLGTSGLVVSLFTAGAFCGAFMAGYLGDMVGRRATIAAASAIFILGGALQAGGQVPLPSPIPKW
jgi:MFS family permease